MAFATLTVDLQAGLARFEKDLKESVDQSKRTTDTIKGHFESLKKALGFVGLGLGLKEFFQELVRSSIEFERSQNSLTATLKATGLAAGITRTELEEMGDALAKSTAFDGEDIRSAEVALLRFRDIQGDVFRDALKATLDLASAQGGKAADAAHQVGKALEDPLHSMKALKDVGVILTEGQKDLIRNFQETGNIAGAQKIVLDALAGSMGGGAVGENVGLYGSTRGLAKAWNDLLVTIGQSPFGFNNDINAATKALELLSDTIGDVSSGLGKSKALLDAAAGTGAPEAKDPDRAAADAGKKRQNDLRQAETDRANALRDALAKVAITSATLQKELQIETDAATEKQTVLDHYFGLGLISIKEYYDAREAIVQASTEAEKAQIDLVIKAQQDLLSKTTDSAVKPGIQAQIAKLKADQAALDRKAAAEATSNAYAREAADQKVLDKITEINIALAEQDHRYEEAARLRVELENRVTNAQLGSNTPANSPDQQRLEQQTVSLGKLNDLTEAFGVLQEEQSTRELRIQNELVRAGGGPDAQLAALHAINAAVLESLPALRAKLDLEEEEANLLSGPAKQQALANVDRERAALEARAAGATGAAAAIAELNIQQRQSSILLGQEGVEEAHIANLRQAGALTSLGAEVELDKVRESSLGSLREQLKLQEALAAAGNDPAATLMVSQLRVQIEALAVAAHSTGKIFEDVFENSATSALEDFADRTKTAGDAFKSFITDIERGINHIAAQEISQRLFGGATGSGGWLSALGNLFGGAASGSGGSGGFSGHMAEGGITSGLTIAGERGPEAVIPLSGGRSVPVTMKGGGAPIYVTMNVITPDANSFRQSKLQITRELNQALARGRQQ